MNTRLALAALCLLVCALPGRALGGDDSDADAFYVDFLEKHPCSGKCRVSVDKRRLPLGDASPHGELNITMVDIGQGCASAAVLEVPHSATRNLLILAERRDGRWQPLVESTGLLLLQTRTNGRSDVVSVVRDYGVESTGKCKGFVYEGQVLTWNGRAYEKARTVNSCTNADAWAKLNSQVVDLADRYVQPKPCTAMVAARADAPGDRPAKRVAFSERAGIEVFADDREGGWCQAEVPLRVVARDGGYFATPEFRGMVPKIGRALAKECPAAKKVLLAGFVAGSGDRLFSGLAERDGDWKLSPATPANVVGAGSGPAPAERGVGEAACGRDAHEVPAGGQACGIGLDDKSRLVVEGKAVTGALQPGGRAARRFNILPFSPSARYTVVHIEDRFTFLIDRKALTALPIGAGDGPIPWSAWSEDDGYVLLASKDVGGAVPQPIRWLYAIRVPDGNKPTPLSSRFPYDNSMVLSHLLFTGPAGADAFTWLGPRRVRVRMAECRGGAACEGTRLAEDATLVELALTDAGIEVVSIADPSKVSAAVRNALKRRQTREAGVAQGDACKHVFHEIALGGGACGIDLAPGHKLKIDGGVVSELQKQLGGGLTDKARLILFPVSASGRYSVVQVCGSDDGSSCRRLLLVDRQGRSATEIPTAVYGPERWIAWTDDEEYLVLSNYDDGMNWLESVQLPKASGAKPVSYQTKYAAIMPTAESFEWVSSRRFRVALACRGADCEATRYPQDLTTVEFELADGKVRAAAVGDPTKVPPVLLEEAGGRTLQTIAGPTAVQRGAAGVVAPAETARGGRSDPEGFAGRAPQTTAAPAGMQNSGVRPGIPGDADVSEEGAVASPALVAIVIGVLVASGVAVVVLRRRAGGAEGTGRAAVVSGAPIRFCTGCGAQLEPGRRFCTSCGTPGPENDAPVSPAARPEERLHFCTSCGARLEDGAQFCTNCGAPGSATQANGTTT